MSVVLNTKHLSGFINEEEYKAIYPELRIIITGGDMFYFEKKLKNNIFANSNLVIAGLKKILDYNLEK